jgi:hypothetical protein
MKKPNFEKWGKRKIKEIRKHTRRDEVDAAEENIAVLSKELGKRYERNGSLDKAKYMYGQAAQSYEAIKDYDMAAKMYHKAGIRSDTKDLPRDLKRLRIRWLEQMGIAACFLILVIGAFILTAKPTGFAISSSPYANYSLGSILIITALVILSAISIKLKK